MVYLGADSVDPHDVINATFPQSSLAQPIHDDYIIINNGIGSHCQIPFWSYKQLEPLDSRTLHSRVRQMLDCLNNAGFDTEAKNLIKKNPKLDPMNGGPGSSLFRPRSRQSDDMIRWLLVTQCYLVHNVNDIKGIHTMLRKLGCPQSLVFAEMKHPTRVIGVDEEKVRGEVQNLDNSSDLNNNNINNSYNINEVIYRGFSPHMIETFKTQPVNSRLHVEYGLKKGDKSEVIIEDDGINTTREKPLFQTKSRVNNSANGNSLRANTGTSTSSTSNNDSYNNTSSSELFQSKSRKNMFNKDHVKNLNMNYNMNNPNSESQSGAEAASENINNPSDYIDYPYRALRGARKPINQQQDPNLRMKNELEVGELHGRSRRYIEESFNEDRIIIDRNNRPNRSGSEERRIISNADTGLTVNGESDPSRPGSRPYPGFGPGRRMKDNIRNNETRNLNNMNLNLMSMNENFGGKNETICPKFGGRREREICGKIGSGHF